jgi:hypothetical protein
MVTATQPPKLNTVAEPPSNFEIIDAKELAKRWALPCTWIREQTRSRTNDAIPHLRMGRYVRFEWNSPALNVWLSKRRSGGGG